MVNLNLSSGNMSSFVEATQGQRAMPCVLSAEKLCQQVTMRHLLCLVAYVAMTEQAASRLLIDSSVATEISERPLVRKAFAQPFVQQIQRLS